LSISNSDLVAMSGSATESSTGECVTDRWRSHAARTPGRDAVLHYVAGQLTRRWTWGELVAAADQFATRLAACGVRPSDVCALIIRHNPEFYPLYMGVELLGAIPAVLAYPNPRLHPDKFRSGLVGMSRGSGLDWILTERALAPVLNGVMDGTSTIRGLLYPLELPPADTFETDAMVGRVTSHPTDPCLLQHSSGTTGLQKAVMLSHSAVLEHVRRYGDAIELAATDRVVSWLPLYHDMGLIATFHLPLAAAVPVVYLDPFEWVVAPSLFLDACSRERATIAWLPNFAYNLMATRANDEDLEGVRLDSLRLLVNCSEPVRAESHDMFAARFAAYGLARHALGASYAMAETTFAVTQTRPGLEARRIEASRAALARGIFQRPSANEPVRSCVSSGTPISGCSVRIVDEAGADRRDGEVGEILIRSVSLFDGYRNNPLATQRALRDGWYASGDLGFLLDGEVFVVGRKKDVIIVAGKNIYPEDVEDALRGVDGLLPGRVVAFGREDVANGTERICVVAETPLTDDAAHAGVREAITRAGMRIDITISEIFLVEPRWLIKSSAGKPSRTANKERLAATATIKSSDVV
jgi:fatty-acyl-CoA synthase